jgi:hypothetical protein
MPKKFRCQAKDCRKKLTAVQKISGKCKCGLMLCPLHKDSHGCTFDHSKEASQHLNDRLESVAFVKIDKL